MVDQAYDDAKQQQADPYMQETMDAMTTSSLSSASLSSAQTAAAWGFEEGPSALGNSAGALFSSVSDLLAKENDLISVFETNVKLASESVKQNEWDNQHALAQVTSALDNVAKSPQAQALLDDLVQNGYVKPQEGASGAETGGGSPSETENGEAYSDSTTF